MDVFSGNEQLHEVHISFFKLHGSKSFVLPEVSDLLWISRSSVRTNGTPQTTGTGITNSLGINERAAANMRLLPHPQKNS